MKLLRQSVGAFGAVVLVLVLASPALAYHDPNVRDLRLVRLDPIACGQPITIEGYVWERGRVVAEGVTVTWDLFRFESGDTLEPTTTVSDANGKVYAELKLACETGNRKIRAVHEPDSDGRGDARDQIVIQCNIRNCSSPAADVVPPLLTRAQTPPNDSGMAIGAARHARETPPLPTPSILNLLPVAAVAGLVFVSRHARLRLAGPSRRRWAAA